MMLLCPSFTVLVMFGEFSASIVLRTFIELA